MHGRKSGEIPARFAAAARQFAEWRRTTTRGTRIPESLWELAVQLAGEHGVWKTARTLKVDYYGLKRRLAEASRVPAPKFSAPSSHFVEVTPSIMASPGECLIELENGDGSKMRIHLKGSQTPDLAALCNSFWSDPS